MKKALFLTILTILLTGCSKNIPGPDNSLRVEKASYAGKIALKALPSGYSALTHGSMGLFAYQVASPENNGVNAQYVYSEGKWEAVNAIKLDPAQEYGIYAYHPYSASGVSYTDTDKKTGPKMLIDLSSTQTDYLYATPLSLPAGTFAIRELRFNRALAKIIVKIAKDEAYTGTGNFTGCALSNASGKNPLANQGEILLSDGTLSVTASASGTEMYTMALKTGTTNNNVTAGDVEYETMIVPVNTAIADGDILVSVTLDGQAYDVPVPATKWERAKIYTYNLKIRAGEIVIPNPGDPDYQDEWSPSVEDWVDGGSNDLEIE